MSASKIARRYAKALAEACVEAKNHAVIGKQLETFAETWTASPELQAVLKSPVVSLADKRDILVKLFAKYLFAPTTRNFVLVLLEHGRIDEIVAVSDAFQDLMDGLSGRVRATVVSAAPLERSELTRIQAALKQLTDKTVMLEARVDPDLLGGVQVRMGNLVLDATARMHLDSMRDRLRV
ncbi:MAG: ATP synthase F1 subunit delta [Deltaproteobacteria bacterium]|nr:ATP synthase F1 subunit delta [Deltaproteobacteria bacterium]